MLSAVFRGQTDGLVCISPFFTQVLSEFPFCVHFGSVTEVGVVVTAKTSFSWATINVRSILVPLANQASDMAETAGCSPRNQCPFSPMLRDYISN